MKWHGLGTCPNGSKPPEQQRNEQRHPQLDNN
jgi:hypothetical protein